MQITLTKPMRIHILIGKNNFFEQSVHQKPSILIIAFNFVSFDMNCSYLSTKQFHFCFLCKHFFHHHDFFSHLITCALLLRC